MSTYRRGFPLTAKGMKAFKNRVMKCRNACRDQLAQRFVELSLDYLYERAAYHIENTVGKGGYAPTGQLLSELKKDYEAGKIFNYCAYAKYVEYGTGVVGKGTHPEPPLGYEYDVNKHGEEGWVYLGDDGNFYWTKGIPAHRFMFNAVVDYQLQAQKIFSKAFDEVMGGAMK